jgi:deoxyribonuclease-4
VAGGYYKAAEQAAALGMRTCQIFTKNNAQWAASPIADEQAQRFQASVEAAGLVHPLAHSSYLINLASPDESLWRRSVSALVVELQRAEQLCLDYVVVHPGAHLGDGEEAGLHRILLALEEVHARTAGIRCRCLLETTAGQGTGLGWRFEQLGRLLDGVSDPERLGVCFDTCHVFAAGYSLAAKRDYQATMREFERCVGVRKICAIHLNDSKRELGSRLDRHEHIGRGKLGADAFRNLLGDRRLRGVPMVLETPKGQARGRTWDEINLCTLRSLIAD